MIEIKIKTHQVDGRPITESSYNISGTTTLSDVSMTLLELEKIKERILDESDKYDPEVEIKNKEE